MNILWYFMLSNQNINTDSQYIFMQNMIEGVLKTDPTVNFVVMMPLNPKIHFTNDGFFDEHRDRVMVLSYPAPAGKTTHALFFNSQLIFETCKKYGICTILNNIPEVGTAMSKIQPDPSINAPLCITYNHYTIHPSLPYPMRGYENLRCLALMGNWFSHKVIFNTRYHYSMHQDNLKEFGFYSNFNEDIEKKLAIVPGPIMGKTMRKNFDLNAPFKTGPKIIFYYNHRLQEYKHYETTFDLLNFLWQTGRREFELWLSYNSGDQIKWALKQYPFAMVNSAQTHDEYYFNLKTPHFNVTNTVHETFCYAILESALLGGIPVIPRRVTFPELFPSDYPFFFSDDEEEKLLLTRILDRQFSDDYLTDLSISLRKRFSEMFENERVGKMMLDAINSVWLPYQRAGWVRLKPEHKKGLADLLWKHNNKKTAFLDLYNEYLATNVLGNQSMPGWRFGHQLECFPHEKVFYGDKYFIVPRLKSTIPPD